jgi:hypothetical protein
MPLLLLKYARSPRYPVTNDNATTIRSNDITWRDTHDGAPGFLVLFDIAATAFFANVVATAAQEFTP